MIVSGVCLFSRIDKWCYLCTNLKTHVLLDLYVGLPSAMMIRFFHIHIHIWSSIHCVKLWFRLIEKVISTRNTLLSHGRSSQCLIPTPQVCRLRLCNDPRYSVAALQR
jgi:hypothetical protein